MVDFSNVASKVIAGIFLQRAIDSEGYEPLDEIVCNLYIGTLEQALNPQLLKDYGITHIVNVTLSGNVFEKGIEVALENIRMGGKSINDLKQGFVIPQYLRVPIADRVGTDIYLHFPRVFQFLDDTFKKSNSKVLVHCQAGVSRSSTLVIAYLMYSQNWTLDQAYQHVKSKRKRIRPNRGFALQLLKFHKSLHIDFACGCEQWLQLYPNVIKPGSKDLEFLS